MNFDRKRFTNIYFDNKNNRFSIVQTDNAIGFIYWHELKKLEVRSLDKGTVFESKASLHSPDGIARGYCLEDFNSTDKSPSHTEVYEKEKFSQDDLLNIISKQHISPVIFIDCTFTSIEIDKTIFTREICFINCIFKSNFRMISCQFYKNLWFPNCEFHQHFSLRNSLVEGNIHMESCDFSGAGGVSLRGVTCNSLYIDLGVKGGDDLIWLNEMTVYNIMSIGGTFNNEFQILSHQDSKETKYSTIGSLFIGCEIYEYEKANSTKICNKLIIDGIKVEKAIRICELYVDFLKIANINTRLIDICSASICYDFELSHNLINTNPSIVDNKAFTLEDTSIGRHLKIENNDILGNISLFGSAVSEVTYMEDNQLSDTTTINLLKFTSSRFLMHPLESIYSNENLHFFSPKKFKIIDTTEHKSAAEQYCSLKHWFSDSGQLDHEDEAFYFMRDYFTTNKFKKFVFGVVFGWGVRLTNITLSSLIVILLFSAIYFFIEPKMGVLASISLSSQSFLGSFFGKWIDFKPDSLVTSIVTFETAIGILFITVFIGAYIRKLLR
ncbi:hypothetical protein NQT69_12345 [Pseudoalteromonas shioyasakiensis]|uniref:hypothetical protein n=1 Tax=Pseudoalteromonas shioyasakiensis TaxID=1190813 RepID=UPI002119528B|nr:hypothetical protein [Pseudoalteromonas shioyasakiensis]MCQ8878793.1 hypothetical protein [Pseudoalteromonas shioyasakiensis]